jgi:ubiquinone/menaquinone biosynthesis C-methylase UbiE
MVRETDALTSATLKHLRERWWNSQFTNFLREMLLPRPGNRILDVGCGVGTAEVWMGQLRLSQVDLFGVDLIHSYVREAVNAAASRNVRVGYAVADACYLPFVDRSFDCTFCVAVLQHVRDLTSAIGEFARVTKPGGRVLAVEPDNAARYWYSSGEVGRRAFELGTRFFTALAGARGDTTDLSVGPKIPAVFARFGIEPTAVRLFPVTVTRLGPPSREVWQWRHEAIQDAINKAPDESIRRMGLDYVKLIDKYADEAAAIGSTFVEIQNTMLFATVGQRAE